MYMPDSQRRLLIVATKSRSCWVNVKFLVITDPEAWGYPSWKPNISFSTCSRHTSSLDTFTSSIVDGQPVSPVNWILSRILGQWCQRTLKSQKTSACHPVVVQFGGGTPHVGYASQGWSKVGLVTQVSVHSSGTMKSTSSLASGKPVLIRSNEDVYLQWIMEIRCVCKCKSSEMPHSFPDRSWWAMWEIYKG